MLLLFGLWLHVQTDGQINRTRKLTLADFKGAPDPGSAYLATTFTHLTYEYGNALPCTEKNKVRFEFQTAMRIGEKSWMKFDKIKNKQLLQELLSHEQGHYDIALVFAGHLQKNLTAACFDRNNYKPQIDSLYRTVSKIYDALQVRYDTETNHGQNRETQSAWKQKIEALSRNTSDLQ